MRCWRSHCKATSSNTFLSFHTLCSFEGARRSSELLAMDRGHIGSQGRPFRHLQPAVSQSRVQRSECTHIIATTFPPSAPPIWPLSHPSILNQPATGQQPKDQPPTPRRLPSTQNPDSRSNQTDPLSHSLLNLFSREVETQFLDRNNEFRILRIQVRNHKSNTLRDDRSAPSVPYASLREESSRKRIRTTSESKARATSESETRNPFTEKAKGKRGRSRKRSEEKIVAQSGSESWIVLTNNGHHHPAHQSL